MPASFDKKAEKKIQVYSLYLYLQNDRPSICLGCPKGGGGGEGGRGGGDVNILVRGVRCWSSKP